MEDILKVYSRPYDASGARIIPSWFCGDSVTV